MGEIAYHYQTKFKVEHTGKYTDWIIRLIDSHNAVPGTINFVFCSDNDLLEMNRKYLKHDYYTDIITFEYEEIEGISGDLFISVDRVIENARDRGVEQFEEFRRVMAHGVLHLIGYGDKTEEQIKSMRNQEAEALAMFHVKHNRGV